MVSKEINGGMKGPCGLSVVFWLLINDTGFVLGGRCRWFTIFLPAESKLYAEGLEETTVLLSTVPIWR
jgi:hypothetical protein